VPTQLILEPLEDNKPAWMCLRALPAFRSRWCET